MHFNPSVKYQVEKRPFQRKGDLYGHVSLYSTRTLKRHLELVGFQVEGVESLSFPYLTRFKILQFIDRICARRSSLGSAILIVAKKRA